MRDAPIVDTVFIKDLRLEAYVGILDHEKLSPQPICISLSCDYIPIQYSVDIDRDRIYICYATIATEVQKMISQRHFYLIETLAERISEICLQHKQVIRVEVQVSKLKAVDAAESVGVRIMRARKN